MSVKIVDERSRPHKCPCDVSPGEAFMFQGDLYLKTRAHLNNGAPQDALRAKTGEPCRVDPFAAVTPVNIKITIHD